MKEFLKITIFSLSLVSIISCRSIDSDESVKYDDFNISSVSGIVIVHPLITNHHYAKSKNEAKIFTLFK